MQIGPVYKMGIKEVGIRATYSTGAFQAMTDNSLIEMIGNHMHEKDGYEWSDAVLFI